MTLTTHAIVGAAAAHFIPSHPVAAFCAAFASHFIIDAIPHRDYKIYSDSVDPSIGTKMIFNKTLLLDGVRIGADALVGVVAATAIFSTPATFWLIACAAAGAILPDALQFVYAHFKHQPLIALQRFHKWIHTDKRFKDQIFLGISSQALFVLAVVVAVKFW